MSLEAMAYVVKLVSAPNGEPVTRDEKAVLYILADAHNAQYRVAWPSVPKIAELALMDERHARRQLRSCEEKSLIRALRPEVNGRNRTSRYVFPELDADPKRIGKGGQRPPFLSKGKGDRKGASEPEIGDRKGTERGPAPQRNKEEPRTENRKNQEPAPALAALEDTDGNAAGAILEIDCGARGAFAADANPAVVWDQVLQRLEARVGAHPFGTWLRPTQGRGVKGRQLVVTVPTDEHLWLVKKYGELIRDAVAECGLPVGSIAFVTLALGTQQAPSWGDAVPVSGRRA